MAETGTTGGSAGYTAMGAVDIQPALEKVRQMPEFQPQTPGLIERLLDDPRMKNIVETVEKAIDAFFRNLREAIQGAMPEQSGDMAHFVTSVISYIISISLVFLLIVAAYLVLTWLRRQIDGRRKVEADANADHPSELLVNAEHHQKEAQRLAALGDYRMAVRQMFLATLCLLEEKKLVPFEATRTDGEYLNELMQLPASELPGHFGDLSAQFERIRFGNLPTDGDGFALYQRRFADMGNEAMALAAQKAAEEKEKAQRETSR